MSGLRDIFEDKPVYGAEKRGNISRKGSRNAMNEEFMDSLKESFSKLALEMKRTNRLKAIELKIKLALQGASLDPKAVAGFLEDIDEEF